MKKLGLYLRWLLLAVCVVGSFMAAPFWYGDGMWKLVLWYAVGVNVATLLFYLYDKDAARQRHQRIPEGVLHLLALAGGSPTAMFAQRYFRHKTRKTGFRNVFWLIVLGHLILAVRGALADNHPLGNWATRDWIYLMTGFVAAVNIVAAMVYAHGTRDKRTTSAPLALLLVFTGGALGAALSDRMADGYAKLPHLVGSAHLAGAVYLAFHDVVPRLVGLSQLVASWW